MTEPMEHDWQYHRKARRIETVEILPPRQTERTVRVDVHVHRRSGIRPQRLVVVAAFVIVGLILVRSPAL